MKFGPVPISDALGAVLAHSVAVPGGRLKKGLVLERKHLSALSDAGLSELTVARLDPEDVAEDAAATRVAAAICGQGLRASVATTGRVNLIAEGPGIVDVDADRVAALNRVDPMITLATLRPWKQVAAGGMVATVKVISYGVADDAVQAACEAGQGALSLRTPVVSQAGLIQTTFGADDGVKGHRVLSERLVRLDVTLGANTIVPHSVDALANALKMAAGEVLFILTGSATSDLHDVAPEALRAAGGIVHHFGMPVDPGNLLFLGALDGRPVIGLPGCARSPALNGADWVMERILCGVPVTPGDIAAMGVGGLLKDIPQRGRMRDRQA
ncbi:molybdopterin-binding protein [Aliiroseovarius subalbicans]|uniref:molybdopterin-binding protein n=1 Tax=Aliiroseovarius subalbicans TaxID=2925840 RepID=UPI001F58AC85|nr:molybdopterin-binding protein [Aliiroseovarius subalbicans]MCI2398844.1 molybdopterin-binding protein [Aliiroseovarius subalbicans]